MAVVYAAFTLVYALLFIVPRTVDFTYSAARTCIPQVTIFPALYKAVDAEQFTVKSGKVLWGVKGVPIVASETCIQPTKELVKGSFTTGLSPYGGWLLQRKIVVTVPEPPAATAAGLNRLISTTLPLRIELSAKGIIHTYSLVVGDTTAACRAADGAPALLCDIATLRLVQGQKYPIEIRRSFGKGTGKIILRSTITTLTATTVVDSSIRNDEIVYS